MVGGKQKAQARTAAAGSRQQAEGLPLLFLSDRYRILSLPRCKFGRGTGNVVPSFSPSAC